MKTIQTLQTEHQAVLQVLDQLERAVAAAERGAAVPPDVFADIQEFFSVFVQRCHHSKEEAEVFPLLSGDQDAEIVDILEAEHRTGHRLAAAYAEAARGYEAGDAESGAILAARARAYSDFLRKHIDLETERLFPAMGRALADSDDAVGDAFERLEEERIGLGTHERLHAMVDGLESRISPLASA